MSTLDVEILLVESHAECYNIRLKIGTLKFTHGSGTHGYSLKVAMRHAKAIQRAIPNAEIRTTMREEVG
jgi:hypothetical protein